MRYRVIPLFAALSAAAGAQVKSASPDPAHAAELAEHGRCQEALPLLKRAAGADKDLQRRLGVAGVRCAMTLNQPADAALFLDRLNREFPHDAAVLYLATHVYSDLATRASGELLYTNPASAEVHELNAEALETRGDWQHAMEEYRTVLQREPNMTGMHYRIGRLILSQPKTETTFADARREFEAELLIDPGNAGAEYVLGELARQEEEWPEAVDHFSKAAKLDIGFADAFIGLGRSLLSAERPAEAVGPLMQATRLDPANPTAHYYAAIALQRTGRKADSDREAALFKDASAKAQQARNDVQLGVLGPQRVERQ
jgi:tetratricopeptide (TPR) repeat protein